MKLKPFWCYYGGKWRSAPRYPAPRYDTIVEPFAGAAGYSTRHHEKRIVLIEADPTIAELATSPCQSPSSWMRSGLRPKSYWGPEVRAQIASQVNAIKHWTVINASYEEAPDIEASFFIDPPYQRAGTHYRQKFKEFDSLGAWCKSRRGQVIVCEEAGADWLPFQPFGVFKASPAKHGGKKCSEAIWIK